MNPSYYEYYVFFSDHTFRIYHGYLIAHLTIENFVIGIWTLAF